MEAIGTQCPIYFKTKFTSTEACALTNNKNGYHPLKTTQWKKKK